MLTSEKQKQKRAYNTFKSLSVYFEGIIQYITLPLFRKDTASPLGIDSKGPIISGFQMDLNMPGRDQEQE